MTIRRKYKAQARNEKNIVWASKKNLSLYYLDLISLLMDMTSVILVLLI